LEQCETNPINYEVLQPPNESEDSILSLQIKLFMPLKIPIFVIVYNRFWCLKRCLASLAPCGQEIVLINNGSDYKPFLDWLATQPYQVIHLPKIHNPGQLYGSIREGVRRWLDAQQDPTIDAYVVTDPDVELEHPESDWVRLMYLGLQHFSKAECVGSALRTDDIPDYYPLKEYAKRTEDKNKRYPIAQWNNVPVRRSRIDTTLAMYRPGFSKTGISQHAIRMHGPCMARHLDWYLNPRRLTPDQIHYFKTSGRLTHFGGVLLHNTIKRLSVKPRPKTRKQPTALGKQRTKKRAAILAKIADNMQKKS